MKRLVIIVGLMCCATLSVCAQTTRPVVLNWTASTSTGVTGYNVYTCVAVSPATSCTPSLSSTPVNVTGVTDTFQANIGSYYGVSVTAVAAPCTSNTPIGTPCGQSAPVSITSIPVPPQTVGATNVIVVVP